MPAPKSLAARLLTRVFGRRPTAPLRRNPLGRRLEEFEDRVVPAAAHVWSRAFGDTGIDTGEAVAADAFGNTYVAGRFQGTTNFGLGGIVAAGTTDGFVAKYDPVGNLAWVRTYGGTGASVFPSGVALDGAGNVVVVGSHTQTVNFGAGPHNAGVTSDIFLVKLDPDGGDVSAQSFNGSGFEFVRSMAIDGAGSVVLTGTFDGTVDFGGGTLTKSGVIGGSTDIFLAKLDAGGNHVFSKRFGDDLSQAGNGAGVDAAGNITLGGNGGGGADFGGGTLPAGLFLAKFDPLGNYLASRSILASSVVDVAVEPDGTAYVAGSFGGTVDFGNGQVVMSAGGNQFYLLKVDPSLATVFARGYGDAAHQSVAAVAADGLGHVALTGGFEGSIDFGNGGVVNSAGGNDLFVAVLDANGSHIASAGYGDTDSQGGSDVALDGSGRLYVAGAFRGSINVGGATFNTNGDFDALVAKYSFAAGTTTATLAGGNLTLTDTADQSDAYTVSASGSDLVIFSPTATFVGAAGAVSPDGHTLTLPLSAVTGVLQLDAAGGDDTLTLDLSGGNPIPAGGVQFNGGAGGNDRLVLEGGTVATQTFNFTNSTDGSVDLSGVGTVAYTGLDPITSTLASAEVILNYSSASEVITIRQFPGDTTRTEAVSTAAESVDFANPTDRLEINAGGGGGADSVIVDGFGTGGGGFAATLDVDGEDGFDSVAVNTPLVLSAAGAVLSLAVESIALNDGTVTTAGTQTYAGDVSLGSTTTMTATEVLFGGDVDLNFNDLTVDQSGDTTVAGAIRGIGGLTKAGAGSLTLAGNNSYLGDTVVDGGRLLVTGTITSDVTVNAAGTLGGTGFVVGNVDGAGTFAPGQSPGALVIVGDFTPAGTLVFEANPPLVNGGIDFDVFLVQGAVDLSGATLTFTGTALFEDPNVIATLIDNDGTDLTTAAASPADGATVVIDGIAFRLFYNGGDGNDVVLIEASSPGTIYVDDDFTASRGQVIADADLGRASQQPAVFGVNAFTTIGEAVAAAPPGGKIVVNGGTYAEAVDLSGPTATELEVTGDDTAQLVTIDSLATDSFRTVSIRGASVLTVGDATDTTIASSLGGTGTLVKQGTGTLSLTAASFGFDGEISVAAGTLRATADDALGSTAGGTTVDVGATLLFDNVSYGSQFFATEALTLGGTVAGAGLSEFNGPITLTGTVFVDVPAAADVLVLSGDIDESAPGSGLFKTGDGTAVLGGFFGTVNTFTGQTVVLAGTLEVNAEQLDSDAVVVDGRLAGDFGVVGSLTAAGGTVDPGEATNTFTGSLGVDGDVILTAAATFHAFLCECESSDSLVVQGTVTLGDAALTLTADPFFEPVFGDWFVLVDNDGVDPVVGTFAGLPEGAIVTVGGFQLQISYAGDTGNDVVLTLVPDLAVGDATVTEGDAGTVLLTFTLTLSAPSSAPISVDYATADDTASAAAGDYAAAAGTVLFLPGQTTRTVSIVVNGDRIDEADETLFLNLSGPVNARVTDGQGLGTITDDDGAPSVSIAGSSVAEGNTGTAAVTFTVTLSNPSSTPVTVNYATADGTATTADGDYTPASGTVAFAPGQTSQTVTVNATGDTTFEPDETFTVTLSAPTGATIGTGAATGTVVNDDAAPVISVNDATVTEGDAGTVTMTFTVSLSNASSTPVTVSFATAGVTAQSGADFTPAAGTVTFAPGELTQTVTVTVAGDTADEPDETLALNLSAAAGGSIGDGQGVGTILDDDGIPVVSVAGTTVAEGTGGLTAVTFTVTLSNPSSTPVTVNYATADGTATTADGDYTPAAGSLLFTPGETTKTVTVFAAADARFETDETVTLALSAPFGATLGTATAASTFTNDDAPPVVSVAGAAVAEGNAGTTSLTFTVTLSAASGLPVTVSFATADGTAVAPGDYTATSGTVTFAPGQTSQTVTVSVVGDGSFEADETLTLTLSAPTGATIGAGTATGTVVNDDPLPVVSVSDATAAEGNAVTTPLTFTVTLSNPSSSSVTVTFATADGTAQAGSDYAAASGTVTFAPGQTSQTVTVNATGDTTFEPTEDFALHLTAAAGGTLGDDQGVGTITNDDAVPVVSIDSPTIAEGNSGSAPLTFTVTLSNPSSSPVTVTYSMTDGTASAGSDFTPAAGTLTFAPGETTKPLPVPVLGDLAHEADETFTMTLAGPTNATLGTATGTGTILNDDPVPVASVVGGSVVEGNTGTTPFDFVVTLSNPSGQVVSIQYTTLDNSAGPGDYQPTSGSVVFAPGETSKTVTVNVVGDRTSEPDETFRLLLTGATAVVFAGAVGVATILDDDAPPTVAIGTGRGTESAVRVYDGTTRRLGDPIPILSHAEFAGGVRTATADVNGDSVLDVIAAAGPGGGSTVVVVDGKTGQEIRRFTAYESSFTGGLFVAAGDMTGDGFAEIVTAPDVGGGGRVRVFDGRTGEPLADFMAIDDWAFRGGARVAVGDLTGDGTADLLVGAGFGGGPRVAGFDGLSLRPGAAPARVFNDFFAFAGRDVDTLRNGVYVAVGDLDGDGFGDAIFGGGPGGAPRVRAVSGRVLTSDGTTQAQLANFYAGDERGRGGVRLAARDLDRDGRAEIIAGGGDGERSRVTIYRGSYTQPEGVPLTYDEFEAFPRSFDGVYVG